MKILIFLLLSLSGFSQDTIIVRFKGDIANHLDLLSIAEKPYKNWVREIHIFGSYGGTDHKSISKSFLIKNYLLALGVKIPITLGEPQTNAGAIIYYDSVRNIYFEGSKAVVLPESIRDLNKLILIMDLNPHTNILIRGHINWPYSWEITLFAKALSIARARRIKEYLLSAGIEERRIKLESVQAKEMIYPKTELEEEMKLNRRVEIRIL